MKTQNLLVRCMDWQEDGNWVALCLDFDLAVQDETREGARQRLSDQIQTYVREALAGPDREHADYFLRRRAPLKYWLRFYVLLLRAHMDGLRHQARAYFSPLPLRPA